MATPAAGTYELDPSHSTVEAVARHLVVSKVRGRFHDVHGTITIGERPEERSLVGRHIGERPFGRVLSRAPSDEPIGLAFLPQKTEHSSQRREADAPFA